MSTNNAINLKAAGITGYDGAGAFVGNAVSNHNIIVGGATSSSLTSVAPSATSGVAVISQGAAADPVFGTVVTAGGGTGLTTLTTYQLMASGTTATGNWQQVGSGSAGQVLYSNGAGALPSFGAAPAALSWVDVTSGTQAISVGTGYVTDNATQVTYSLPAAAAFGSVFKIVGGVSGATTAPWTISQGTGQSINIGSSSTTSGAGGSLTATLQYDCVEVLCIVADLTFEVINSVGNITVV